MEKLKIFFSHCTFLQMIHHNSTQCDEFCTKCAVDNFLDNQMEKLSDITLHEIIYDPIFRNLFARFIQYQFFPYDTESVSILKRFILCEKILKKPDIIDNPVIYETLIELSPTFTWEERIRKLSDQAERNLNFLHMMENLKWETLVELICHHDYERFLRAIDEKSLRIKNLLREIYRGE